MNVKQLDFETVWLEFHEIEPEIVKLGGKPTGTKPDGYALLSQLFANSLFTPISPYRTPWYTLPVIYDPATEQVISNAKVIAEYLDKQYPKTQKLIVDPTFEVEWGEVILNNVSKNFPPSTFIVLHDRASAKAGQHIRKIREAQFNATLEDLSTEDAVDRQWKAFEEGFTKVSEFYKEVGTAFLSKRDAPMWADLMVGAVLISQKFIYGEDSKQWESILEWDGGLWKRLNEALQVYEGKGIE